MGFRSTWIRESRAPALLLSLSIFLGLPAGFLGCSPTINVNFNVVLCKKRSFYRFFLSLFPKTSILVSQFNCMYNRQTGNYKVGF